jgi:hypothetical protein
MMDSDEIILFDDDTPERLSNNAASSSESLFDQPQQRFSPMIVEIQRARRQSCQTVKLTAR